MGKLNLSKRLKTVLQLVGEEYDLYYDICCDHGHLGQQLLFNQKKVTFIDQIKNITESLSIRLKATDIPSVKYKVITQDIRICKIQNSDAKAIRIIIGVGGELIIKALELNNDYQGDYLLCAHQNPQKLRKFLISNDFKLKKQLLIQDNKKFYDFVLVNKTGSETVSEVPLEYENDTTKSEFIDQEIDFFTLKAKHDHKYQDLLNVYKSLKP